MNHYSAKELLHSTWNSIQEKGTLYQSSNSGKSVFQGEFKEILNFNSFVENPLTRTLDSSNFNIGFALARFFYLLRGTNTLKEIVFYSPRAAEYSDNGEHLFGSSYGYKIFKDGNFWNMVQKLKETHNSKRLYLPIFTEDDFLKDSKDIPCATGLLLQPRDNTLNMTLQMRANDAQKLLPYNLFEFSLLQECLAIASGMNLGVLYYNAGTIHLRGEKDIENNINPWEDTETLEMLPMQSFDKEVLKELLFVEEKLREEIPSLDENSYIEFINELTNELDGYWRELIITLADYGYLKTHQVSPPKFDSVGVVYDTYMKNKI